jgi:hypothetical protein
MRFIVGLGLLLSSITFGQSEHDVQNLSSRPTAPAKELGTVSEAWLDSNGEKLYRLGQDLKLPGAGSTWAFSSFALLVVCSEETPSSDEELAATFECVVTQQKFDGDQVHYEDVIVKGDVAARTYNLFLKAAKESGVTPTPSPASPKTKRSLAVKNFRVGMSRFNPAREIKYKADFSFVSR